MRSSVLLLCLLLFASTVAAVPPVGTEEDPEIRDRAGNVEYHPLYTGSHDRDHVDLLAAWIEHVDDGHRVKVTVKVESLETLPDADAGWHVGIFFSADLEADGQVRTVSFQAYRGFGDEEFGSVVSWAEGTNAFFIEHGFDVVVGTPGYLSWTVSRESLQTLGQEMSNLRSSGIEEQFVAGFLTTGIFNRNQASSNAEFDLTPPPAPAPTGTTSRSTSASSSTTNAPDDVDTPVPLAAGLMAVLAALAMRRRAS